MNSESSLKATKKAALLAKATSLGITYEELKAQKIDRKEARKRKRDLKIPEQTTPTIIASAIEPTQPPPSQSFFVPLADRLNPNRRGYDPDFATYYKSLNSYNRKQIAKKDTIAIKKWKAKKPAEFNFEVEETDHCETSPQSFQDIDVHLSALADSLCKTKEELQIYDPYYCNGATIMHLAELGYHNVFNKNVDFYNSTIPAHDVLITNPPYTGDHCEKLFNFLLKNKKPYFILLPDYFQKRKFFPDKDNITILKPPSQYHYWTPSLLRSSKKSKKQHSNLALGIKTSPFASSWIIHSK